MIPLILICIAGFALIFFLEKKGEPLGLPERLALAFGLGLSILILLGRILFS